MDNWSIHNNVVVGLKVRVTAEWLSGHLAARAEYHAKRAEEKRAYLPQLEDAAAKLKAQSPAATIQQFSKSASNYRFDGDDAVEQLKADIETHHNKSLAFQFLAGALFPQDYCLDRNDLIQLEILKQ